MSIILMLPQIIEESKTEYQGIKKGKFRHIESFIPKADFLQRSEKVENTSKECDDCLFENVGNLFVKGDNLSLMKSYYDGHGKKIQMIYIDPPFFSKAKYGMEVKLSLGEGKSEKIKQIAYTDTWDSGLYEYLKMLTVRFYMMKDILADDGCLWIHLDWHVVHYVKIILDEVFGADNFINEVIWQYKSGGSSKKHFSRKHDTLLFYAKSKNYYFKAMQEKSYNRGFKPYRFKGVKEYKDELGWYTMVNMKDVWHIDMVGRTSRERTGYATQKPEALLARIMECCTREGDIVADFFGGSGTLAVVAAKMGRNFIHCDMGNLAIANARKRFSKLSIPYMFYQQDEDNSMEISSNDKGIKIDIRAYESDVEMSDKKLLTVELLNYDIDLNDRILEQLGSDEKTKKLLTKLKKSSNLSFIDYWSIDCSYNGKVFRPEIFLYNENGQLNIFCVKTGENFSNIAVNVVDVFGKSSIKSFKL